MSNPQEGIAALPTPCWVLVDENGKQQELGYDGIRHLETEADATEEAGIYVDSFEEEDGTPPTLRPERLAQACLTATSACGYRYDVDGDGIEHHDSREELRRTVESVGWRVVGGQLVCDPDCGDCKDALAEQVGGDIRG
jgi:hypothetical protein